MSDGEGVIGIVGDALDMIDKRINSFGQILTIQEAQEIQFLESLKEQLDRKVTGEE